MFSRRDARTGGAFSNPPGGNGEHRSAPPLNRRGMQKALTGPVMYFMPPEIKALFEPGPMPPALPLPNPKNSGEKSNLTGLAQIIKEANIEFTKGEPEPEVARPTEKKILNILKRQKEQEEKLRAAKLEYNPGSDPLATKAPMASLFVGRLDFKVTEEQLRREFQKFGPIEHVRVVRDQNGKSRGYAFIQFERESDIPNAYDGARGMTINGRKIIVDVERGRTVRNWLPKRLGGGLGHTRPAHPPKKRDTKAEHVYPPIGSFAVIIPPSLEESTSRKAVTERALNTRREITRILSGRVASTPAVPARGIEETQHRGRDRSRSRERYI